MRSYRVYSKSDLNVGQSAVLDERSSHHLARVLRVKVDDAVTVFNGDGDNYHSRISAVTKTNVTVDLLSKEDPCNESPLATHLGLAVSKGDRFEWAIKKATELGVSSISPILSQRVDVRLAPSVGKRSRITGSRLLLVPASRVAAPSFPKCTRHNHLEAGLKQLKQNRSFVCTPA